MVESLIINARELKQNIDSESLDDLLQVERCILHMRETNRITKKEEELIKAFSVYKTKESVAFMLEENEQTVARLFKEVCERIAFDLGSYFTDEGLLDYMQTKYNLEFDQVDILRSYMKSTTRHTLLHRTYKKR